MPAAHAILSRAELHYRPGYEVHTASSGPLPALDCLYLRLVWPDGLEGASEVRVNVAYATGWDLGTVVEAAGGTVSTLAALDDPREMLADLDRRLGPVPAPVRLLVEAALQDAAARAEGTSAAARLAGTPVPEVSLPTHQTLFHGSREAVLGRAQAYWNRGFAALKLRIGFGDLDSELAQLAALRERFGPGLTLSADANGALAEADLRRTLDRLAELRLAYLEQPLPPSAWAELCSLARRSPVPIMLDESADSGEALDRIAASGLPFLVHLKLVKQGGLDRLAEAARRLQGAGIGVMVGQMNEGGLATAAALAAALAIKPRFAELYGADNLVDDPSVGLRYRDGEVVADRIGIGATLAGPTALILDREVAR